MVSVYTKIRVPPRGYGDGWGVGFFWMLWLDNERPFASWWSVEEHDVGVERAALVSVYASMKVQQLLISAFSWGSLPR